METTGTLQKSTKTGIASYLPAYTALWFLCVAVICLVFRINGKTFVWKTDALPQHYIAFNYLCEWLHSLLVEHRFPGFFNFTMGQGLDILTTLDSYDFTDPVSVVAALIVPLSRVQRYTLMIFLKLYLTGFSFLLYCSAAERKNRFAVLAGALAYTFSGAVLYTFARHPNYANWAYYFPFLLAGVEYYTGKKKRAPLVAFVFLNAVTSFYTFYMNVILTAIYVFTGSLCRIAKSGSRLRALKAEGKTVLELVAVGAVGILLSACVLLPTIHAYLDNYRVGVASGYTASMLHYEWKYYFKLPEALFAVNYQPGYSTALGLNLALFFPLVLLYVRKGEHTELKVLLILSLLMLCVPMAGRVLNGFGYATNRWCYAVPFYVSVAFVEMFDDMQTMTRKEKTAVFLAAAAYLALCLVTYMLHSDLATKIAVLRMMAAFAGVTVLFWLMIHFQRGLCLEYCLLGLVLCCAMLHAFATFSPAAGYYVGDFLSPGEVEAAYSGFSATAVSDTGEGFFRVEAEEQEEHNKENMGGYHGVNGTSFYWSLFPGPVYDYYRELGLSSVAQNCRLAGLNGRTGLLELAGVKYYTKPAVDTGLVPCGYQEIGSPDGNYQVYENRYALPIGYTYSGYITREEYDALDGIGKEQALLQAAVLEAPVDSASIGRAYIVQGAESLNYDLENMEGVAWEENCLLASGGGTITLAVNVPEDSEVYLALRKIRLVDLIPKEVPKQGYIVELAAGREADGYSVKKVAYVAKAEYRWPVFRDDIICNLGYGHAGENLITLEFGRAAEMTVDHIEVIAVPMSSYPEHAKSLGEYALESVEVGADRVIGKISVPEERILQFAIPYSAGWTAAVDGENAELFRSDVMYFSTLISPGTHDVELRYETPWLRTGVIISLAALVLWIGYEVLMRRHNREKG